MPLTDAGYEPRTEADIQENQRVFLRASISEKLDLSERTVLGNWTNIGCDHLAQLEQLIQESLNAADRDNATSDRLSSLAILIGVPRRETPTTGLVMQTLNLDAGQTFAPGDIEFQVADEPENVWHNRDEVVSTIAGEYDVVFESDLTGSTAAAAAGTLTLLIAPTDGTVNSGTNASDAQAGKDRETDGELRVRMAQGVASGGSHTINAIRAALVNINGVLSADVFENVTSIVDSRGIPPHSIRCVVWDGSPAVADDDAIAQAIWDLSATYSVGSQVGTAVDENLGDVEIHFDRPAVQDIVIAVTVESASGVAEDDIKAAIIAAMPTLPGQPVTLNRLAAAVFSVPGVDDWTAFTVDGGSSDLPADVGIIYRLDSSDIAVAVV